MLFFAIAQQLYNVSRYDISWETNNISKGNYLRRCYLCFV